MVYMDDSDALAEHAHSHNGEVTTEFAAHLTERVHGRRVRVESGQGQRFEGILEQVCIHQRHVLLRKAYEIPGGATYQRVFVADVDWIVVTDDSSDGE